MRVWWVQGAVMAAMGVLSPAGVLAQSGAPDPLWVGVIRTDGMVIPFARLEGGVWSAAWPEPVYDEAPEAPPGGAPAAWRVHAAEGASEVMVHELVVIDAYCGRNWAQATDWVLRRPGRAGYVGRVAGMVVGGAVEVVPETAVPGIGQYRERFGLVSDPREGEGYLESTALGYFRTGSGWVGVFLQVGYEGERYEVHEISPDGGGPAVRVHGGGC